MFFESPQYVRIHGKTVYTVYNVLMVLLVVFNAIYLISQGEHMNVDRVHGGHIFAFLEAGKSNVLSKRGLSYCDVERRGYHCEIVDAQELVQSSRGRVFVRTSRRRVDQSRDCPDDAMECPLPLWKNEREREQEVWFAVTPELNNLVLEHSLHRSKVHDDLLAGSSRLFNGFLLANGGRKQEFPPGSSSDRICMQDLLAAGGVSSLDEQSDFVGKRNLTFRETGVALELYISYSNLGGERSYVYEVTRVPVTRVRRLDTQQNTNTTRVLTSSVGVSVTVHLSGTVGSCGLMSILNGVVVPSISMTALVVSEFVDAAIELP
jgi:hypothetical protein